MTWSIFSSFSKKSVSSCNTCECARQEEIERIHSLNFITTRPTGSLWHRALPECLGPIDGWQPNRFQIVEDSSLRYFPCRERSGSYGNLPTATGIVNWPTSCYHVSVDWAWPRVCKETCRGRLEGGSIVMTARTEEKCRNAKKQVLERIDPLSVTKKSLFWPLTWTTLFVSW